MKTLRGKLLSMWLMVTIIPLTLTLWLGHRLIDRSLSFAPIVELDRVSAHMRAAAREHYQAQSIALQQDIDRSKVQPQQYKLGARARWPEHVAEFWASGETQRIRLTGSKVNQLELAKKIPGGVAVYRRELKLSLTEIEREYAAARKRVEQAHSGDVRRGSTTLFLLLASLPWFASLGVLIWAVRRMSRPIQHLTKGLRQVGSGVQNVRLSPSGPEEVSQAMEAFNGMAAELESSRERLLYLTRIESWQALARKMAHEVKNSLTPIRLTVEELAARNGSADAQFHRQVSEIIVEEVGSLERRVRAFSELAAEPPVEMQEVLLGRMIAERITLLQPAYGAVRWREELPGELGCVRADEDLLRAIFTNLLENAAEACAQGGEVAVRGRREGKRVFVSVNDSGPGLQDSARAALFEPSISFKPGGMGIGLSIARKSALLCGGDITLSSGSLPGACFEVQLEGA
jgi:two-component system, NtrC family, nitrogen regulation sensor histidine kinase NtrY